jgi:Alkylmercury lyase
MPSDDFDIKVKLAIYEMTAETGRVPNSSEISRRIHIEENEVLNVFGRLHAKRLLLPEPGDLRRIRMAPPFSGLPTAFPVEANGKQYYANCVWDAYGIAAALHCDAISRTSDGHTGQPLALEVKAGAPVLKPYVAHFAIPAAHWVGRSHFHLSNDAPLPVGRDRQSVVRDAQYPATAHRRSRAIVATRRSLVQQPAHR